MEMIKTASMNTKTAGSESAAQLPVPEQIRIYLNQGEPAEAKPVLEEDGTWTAMAEKACAGLRWTMAGGAAVLKMDAAAPNAGTFDFQPVFDSPRALELDFTPETYESHVAVYHHKVWWMRPSFGKAAQEIPDKTQLLILKRGSEYEVFMAYCDRTTRADISGNGAGIRVSISTSGTNHDRLAGLVLLWGKGEDPYAVVHKCAQAVRSCTGERLLLRDQKSFPPVFDGEGWCSWDSMGRDVSEKLIIEKMEELRRKGHAVRWVLIDDGWSETDQKKETLLSFGADPQRFPGGLAQTVRILKEQYHVRHVGVWQAAKGYWHGVERGSRAHLEMAEHLQVYGNGELSYRPDAGSAFAFWSRWHSELRAAGIDFVKIDGQSSLQDMIGGYADCGESLRQIYEGMEASVFLHFGGSLINCMGMAPDNIWARTYSSISRTSDDYLPRELSSFPEHARQNAWCSVLHGELYFGDWDMFWSTHPDARRSVLLRMISGGPLYTSDGIGKTEPSILAPAVGDDADVLRCSGIGRPTLDCLTTITEADGQERRVLKLYNTVENAAGRCVVVAAFDLKKEAGAPAADCIRTGDIPEWTGGAGFVFDWKQQSTARFTADESYTFTLPDDHADIFTLIPDNGGQVSVIGMTDKYVPMAGIRRITGSEGAWEIETGCAGTLGVMVRGKVQIRIGDGPEQVYSGTPGAPAFVRVPVPAAGCRVSIISMQTI